YSTWYGELQVPDQLGNSVLNTMVEDELIRQKAQSLNISVSEADIDAQIKKLFGYDPATANLTPTPSPSPTLSPTPLVSPTPSPVPTASPTPDLTTMTPTVTPLPSATPSPTPNATEEATQVQKAQDDFFANMRSTAGVGDADIREYFRTLALREKVRDAEITDITHTAPFIDARHILVADETTANTVLAALKAGESFASLAKSMSSDNSASGGGELGWAPATNYVKEFADAAKAAEIGALVGPVKSQFGYHIIQVRAREDRPLSDSDYQTAINNEFATYLKDLRADPSTNVQIFDAWTDNVPTTPAWVPNF
ncbi:MAG: peptidylprolyl isomerase, partial [Chloroflexota bacterium]